MADFISQRDNFKCSYENVYLLNGASEGIKTMLFMAIKHDPDKRTGIMVPLPQYPLYSAAIAQLNAEMVRNLKTCVLVHICMYVRACVHVQVCMHVLCVHLFSCIHVCMFVCACVACLFMLMILTAK